MPVSPNPSNNTAKLQDLWMAETERFEPDQEDFDAAHCAELADELDLFRVQAESDPDFFDTWSDWELFLWANELWLPLEQCCNDGVLLPMDMRALRVQTCPEKLLRPLRRFFENCPAHVKHHIAMVYYVLVRIERARRTGSAEWRPETAEPRSWLEDTAFFRPPRLTVRKYTG